jgi:hypothetical protein
MKDKNYMFSREDVKIFSGAGRIPPTWNKVVGITNTYN